MISNGIPLVTEPSSAESPKATDEPWTVRRVLEWTTSHLKKHGSDTPRLDAEILLSHARGCQRIQLYTQFNEPLSDEVRGMNWFNAGLRLNRLPISSGCVNFSASVFA